MLFIISREMNTRYLLIVHVCGPQSPQVSPRGSCASLDRRLSGLSIKDVTEFPIVPPERGLVKATLCWQHAGQVRILALDQGLGHIRSLLP